MTWTNPPDSFPPNVVLPFLGSLAQVPEGWVVCDGSLGTQDLRQKYVRGVSSNTTAPGVSGGNNSYTLSSAQLAAHNHSGNTGSAGEHRHIIRSHYDQRGFCCSGASSRYGPDKGNTQYGGSHSHSGLTLGYSGGNSSVNNNPAHVNALYIQKL